MSLADWLDLLQGVGATLALAGVGILLGLPLGLAVALARRRGPLAEQGLSAVVGFLRAAPLVTLGLLLAVGLGQADWPGGPALAGALLLALAMAAESSEVWRAGLVENPRPTPVALLRACLPGLLDEASRLLGRAPAIAVLGLADVSRVAIEVGARNADALPPVLAAAGLYGAVALALLRARRRLGPALAPP